MRLAISILCLFCSFYGFSQNHKKYVVNPLALQLNDSAMQILAHSPDYNKEVFLLKKAIEVDSNYLTAYSNLVSAQATQKYFDDALETSLKILTLKREMFAQYYTMVGMLYDVKRDTISSFKYYTEALTHFDKELDSLDKADKEYDSRLANKAITLILTGTRVEEGNELLKKLNAKQTGWRVTFYNDYIGKTKWEIIDEIFNGQGCSETHTSNPTRPR